MKLFSYKSKNYTSIGIKYGQHVIDFNKAYLYFNGEKSGDVKKFLSLDEIILNHLHTRYFLSRFLNLIKKDNLWDKFKIDSYRYLPVLSNPQKFICIGRNYIEHAAESGNKVPQSPIFFLKANSSMIAHLDKIVIPDLNLGRVDHEVELAVIIGKKGKNISKETAMNYVAGYTVVNDITARELQRSDAKKGHPWARAKSIDTFGPIGPYFVPRGYLKDPYNLRLFCKVDGEIKQDGNTKDMVFKIDDLIAYLSKFITLYPNDIIATGTVSGISEIKSGHILEAYVEKIGTLKNRVIERKV
ncbi:fumarylacetoacetate hydrolase family protein [candidate division KSB1 bacterium]